MAEPKIRWSKKAFRQYVDVIEWYSQNVGLKAASSFVTSVREAYTKIQKYPTIGMLDRKNSNTKYEYRSLLIHPKYRIHYRITQSTIWLVAIHCNLKDNSL